MVTLNFPNGNVQTYSDWSAMTIAVNAMGGTYQKIDNETYVFIPKK